jgi:hypothetical protein
VGYYQKRYLTCLYGAPFPEDLPIGGR